MSYTGNEQQWRKLIEVDWLGQYAKAWVAFNAWYRNNFDLVSDRQIIEAIKNDKGDICSKIENFLLGVGTDQKSFQSDIADLQSALSGTVIKSDKKWISFETIEDYKHAKSVEETRNKILYKIEINPDQKKRIVVVTNSAMKEIFKKTIKREEEEVGNPNAGWFDPLSKAQQDTLAGFLRESKPVHNLLSPSRDHLEIGSFKFVNNANLIARAIIETLYQLRNSLFHGEITPDSQTQRVYQPAYLILKSIIPGE